MDRRDFLKTTAAGSVLAMVPTAAASGQRAEGPADDRDRWVGVLRRLADPVLTDLANGTLKARMPVEQAAGADRRARHAPGGARTADRRHRAVDRAAAGRHRRRAAPRAVRRTRAPRDRARGRSGVAGLHELHARPPAAGRRRVPRARSCCGRRARCATRLDATTTRTPRRRARIDAARSCRGSTTGCCFRRRSKPG